MAKKHGVLFLVLGLVFMISNVYGASFGTFPYQIEKQSSNLDVSYRIGFINPSPQPVRVNLSSEKSEEYNVSFSEQIVTVPSSITDSPSGSGWYHLGNGEYTKIQETSFQVDISQYREDNSLSFPVRVEASSISDNSTEGEGSRSRIVHVRNYRYRAEIDPSLRPEERPEESESSWSDRFWEEETSSSKEDFNLNQNKSSNQEPQSEKEEQKPTTSTNNTEEQKSKSSGSMINKTTLILIIGIIASAGYIMTEA